MICFRTNKFHWLPRVRLNYMGEFVFAWLRWGVCEDRLGGKDK